MLDFLAEIFGSIMNLLCLWLKAVGIVSLPAGIIFFAVVMSLLLLPITIGQIRFSLAKPQMAPKMQAIQEKYAGMEMTEEDVRRQSQEIKAVYREQGVTPSGKIGGMILQIILLMAMYQVAGNVPRYVPMFQDVPAGALSFFGHQVSEIPMQVLTGPTGQIAAILPLGMIFLSMIPFSEIRRKNAKGVGMGLLYAILWTLVASKLPIGLCLYWGSRSITGVCLGRAVSRVLKKKSGKKAVRNADLQNVILGTGEVMHE